jgi:hypothetical protein
MAHRYAALSEQAAPGHSQAAEGAKPTEHEGEPVEHGPRCSTNGLLKTIPTVYALNSSDVVRFWRATGSDYGVEKGLKDRALSNDALTRAKADPPITGPHDRRSAASQETRVHSTLGADKPKRRRDPRLDPGLG